MIGIVIWVLSLVGLILLAAADIRADKQEEK